MPLDAQLVARQAQTADVALLTIGRSSGEMFDRKVAGDFCLSRAETQTVSLTFAVSDLASFSEAQSAWVVDAGTYNLLIGASSQDIRATISVDVPAQSTPVSNVLPLSTELQPLKR